jgi:hypothetical protein
MEGVFRAKRRHSNMTPILYDNLVLSMNPLFELISGHSARVSDGYVKKLTAETNKNQRGC